MRFIVVPIYSDSRTGHAVKDTLNGKLRFRYRCGNSLQKATAKAAALNNAAAQRPTQANGQSGNVFFTLFGAVALVGVLGASTMTLMQGPVSTVAAVNKQVRTESRLMVAGRLAALEAAENGTDCDGDGVTEPIAPATGPECSAAQAAGGGCIPVTVGGDKTDPWGSPIMYCAYDHGAGSSGCSADLLAGNADPSGLAVLAVVSAGPDRTFQTTCGADPAYVTRAGDDLAYVFDESEAAAAGAGGGLWSLVSGDPTSATISKDLQITTAADFTGAAVSLDSTSTLDLAGRLFLPTDSEWSACLGPDKGVMRFHDATANIQVCDGAGNWLALGARTLDALDDVPAYGAAGDFLRVNGTADGVAFASASLLDLSDTPAAYGGAGDFLRVNGAGDGVAFASASFLDLADTPGTFTGAENFALVVNGAGDGVAFVSSSLFVGPAGPQGPQGPAGPAGAQGPAGPAGADAPDNFLDLTDAPDAYTGEGGKVVTVKADESGLEFTAAGGGGALACSHVNGTAANTTGPHTATCPVGTLLTGGGCETNVVTGGAVRWMGRAGGQAWTCYFTTANAANSAKAVCCSVN